MEKKRGRPTFASQGKQKKTPKQSSDESDLKKKMRRLAKKERAEWVRVAGKMTDFVAHWEPADRPDVLEFLLRIRLICSDETVIMGDEPAENSSP
jgi:hypothetical protein